MKDAFLNAVKYPYRAKATQLIRDTPIEIAIGAFVMAMVFGYGSHYAEEQKDGKIPLAFSEIEKITREFQAQDKPVPPLTKFYASLNDVLMKIFEANNMALAANRSHSRFASELEVKMDRALRIHRQIPEYVATFQADTQAALQSLSQLTEARKNIAPATSSLAQSWDEHHRDVTKTVTRTVKQCDSKGENCRDVEVEEEVYDYTIHTYTYYPQHGNNADSQMKAFFGVHASLQVQEQLHLSKVTGVDNEYAMEQSMSAELGGKIPTKEQARTYAGKWATGSSLMTYQPSINNHHYSLSKTASAWSTAKNSARSDRYRTSSRSDDGPREFQMTKSALRDAQGINRSISAIIDNMQSAGYTVPALNGMIKEYIAVVKDGKNGDPDALRADIMKTAVRTYKANFAGGLDVQPYKWEHVLGFAMLGLLLGGLTGAGLDYAGNRRRTVGNIFRRYP